MVLPVDEEDYSYRFYKTLNMDVKLEPNQYGEWDIVFDRYDNDWVNVSGFESVHNACLIAIMTRFQEENRLGETSEFPPYEDFGCRVHELIKANKTKNVLYLIEVYVTETLESIRRIRKVNWVIVEDAPDKEYYNYRISFSVSCVRDELYDARVDDLDYSIIEDKFYI